MSRSRVRRWCWTPLVLALAAAALTACSLTPDSAAAAQAARDFHAAIDRGDGRTACGLLAPATAEELGSTEDASCAQALDGLELPSGGGTEDIAAYVDSARVRLAGDVVFVAEFEDRWLVVAAGCERQPDDSYDCTVKGG